LDDFSVPTTAPAADTNISSRGTADTDLFAKLPYDLLHFILLYLPEDSIIPLITASSTVYNLSRNNNFWKTLLHQHTPWLWELSDLLSEQPRPNLDYRRLFRWLAHALTVPYGLHQPLAGLANRKRVWKACEQLYGFYEPYVPRFPPTKDEAHAISKSARAPRIHSLQHLPHSIIKTQLNLQSHSLLITQWVRSWPEMWQPAIFETCFFVTNKNHHHSLAGVSLAFAGGERRPFGTIMHSNPV
jgi:hypothetical protein